VKESPIQKSKSFPGEKRRIFDQSSKQEKGGSDQKWRREKGKGIWRIWLYNEPDRKKKKANSLHFINAISLYLSLLFSTL